MNGTGETSALTQGEIKGVDHKIQVKVNATALPEMNDLFTICR